MVQTRINPGRRLCVTALAFAVSAAGMLCGLGVPGNTLVPEQYESAGMDGRQTHRKDWENNPPRRHSVAWPPRRSWAAANEKLAPTFDAYRKYLDTGGRVDLAVNHGAGSWQETGIIRERETIEADRAEWGEPAEGIEVRLRAQQTTWRAGETPRLLADVRNTGPRRFNSNTNNVNWQIEVNGTWYGRAVEQGKHPNGFSFVTWSRLLEVVDGPHWRDLPISLDASWRTPDRDQEQYSFIVFPADYHRDALVLSPGKHTVRLAIVAYAVHHGLGPRRVRAVSNPVEIEIEIEEWPGAVLPFPDEKP